jgi:hypothetical protein
MPPSPLDVQPANIPYTVLPAISEYSLMANHRRLAALIVTAHGESCRTYRSGAAIPKLTGAMALNRLKFARTPRPDSLTTSPARFEK